MYKRVMPLVLLMVSITASAAVAQTPPAPAALPAAAPKKFTGSLTAGVSFESGRTDLYGVNVVLSLGYRKTPKTNFGFELDEGYASTKPQGAVKRLRLNDSQVMHFKFEHDAARHLILVAQTTATRDVVRRIRHRVEEFAGAGLSLGDRRVSEFRLIPVVAATVQDKNVELEEHVQAGAGLMQDLTAKFNKVWSVDQHILYRRYFGNERDYAINATASVTAQFTPKLGLQLAYVHSHENFVVPGTVKWQRTLQSNLSYDF